MLFQDTFITTYILILTAILGAVFASFINCMAWRITHKENVLKGRSHCAVCGHPLGAADLIPVFSYLFLGGKCRYCKEKISPRYLAVELLMALGFVSVVLRYDVSLAALRYLVLLCILLGLSLVDLETCEIPDGFIVAGIVWWAVTLPLMGEPVLAQLKEGLLGGIAIGGGMLVLSLIFDFVTKKEGMGGGDIKLYFMVSLYLGIGSGLLNLIFSCVIGLIFAAVLRKNKIPFGPSIAAATWVSLIVGDKIVSWYLGLFL